MDNTQREMNKQILDRIASDPKFREELLDDPRGAMERAGFKWEGTGDDVTGYGIWPGTGPIIGGGEIPGTAPIAGGGEIPGTAPIAGGGGKPISGTAPIVGEGKGGSVVGTDPLPPAND